MRCVQNSERSSTLKISATCWSCCIYSQKLAAIFPCSLLKNLLSGRHLITQRQVTGSAAVAFDATRTPVAVESRKRLLCSRISLQRNKAWQPLREQIVSDETDSFSENRYRCAKTTVAVCFPEPSGSGSIWSFSEMIAGGLLGRVVHGILSKCSYSRDVVYPPSKKNHHSDVAW